MKQSRKALFTDIWRRHGWDRAKGDAVWHVEFKFKREALHELQRKMIFGELTARKSEEEVYGTEKKSLGSATTAALYS